MPEPVALALARYCPCLSPLLPHQEEREWEEWEAGGVHGEREKGRSGGQEEKKRSGLEILNGREKGGEKKVRVFLYAGFLRGLHVKIDLFSCADILRGTPAKLDFVYGP
jgi:hypothetical protein